MQKLNGSPARTAAASRTGPHGARVARLRALMLDRRLDGFLALNRMDQYWLTGFTGEDGGVLVTPRNVILITDGRFDDTADQEAPWCKKVIRKQRGPESFARVLQRNKLARVGFDPASMTVLDYGGIARGIRPAKLVSVSRAVADMRVIKDESEIAAIRNAIRIAEQAFAALSDELRPGASEQSVAARLTYLMQERGAQRSAFEPIVASGPSGALPHYEPGPGRISRKDGVLIDWGARAGWYVSDLTRMLWPNSMPARLAKAYEAVREAHDKAIAAIQPGVESSRVDAVAREHLKRSGFGDRFTHSLGHGIGLDVHEAPRLGQHSTEVLRPGMVVTVEPGVYLPGVGGVRLEDDVLVTSDGREVLSSLPL